jgi:hypothetical protein
MSKLRNPSMLQDCIDKELGWRVKEVADLTLSIKSSPVGHQRTLVRAGVPLLYAHWEGFIKNSSLSYIQFVNDQGLRLDQLSDCFIVFGAKKHLSALAKSRKSHMNIDAVNFFTSRLNTEASLSMSSAVNTESNLSSSVFDNIAISIGINPEPYSTRYNLIDISLLKRRNEIAHGEYLDLKPEEYRALVDEVLELMRWYKTDIENAVALGTYKR